MSQVISRRLYLLLLSLAISAPTASLSQTFDQPVVITVIPAAPVVRAGASSALLINLKIPRGFLIGTGDRAARNPAATVIAVDPLPGFQFGAPSFPTPVFVDIPVHKGQTTALSGEIQVVVPFTTTNNTPVGRHTIGLHLTYTPALAAGHLRSHVREPYATTVEITTDRTTPEPTIPTPSARPVRTDFAVHEVIKQFSQPMRTLMYRWPEDGTVARALHTMWHDPANHGKHIQTAWIPFVTFSEKSGQGLGMSAELVNATREGIMTGFLQMRGYDNEYIGTTGEMKVISCPDAYYNYQFSGEYSSGGHNRQLHFHLEHIGLGADKKRGLEMRLDFAHDPRARFHGLGAGTTDADQSNYSHEENGGVFDYYTLPTARYRFGLGAQYRSVNVAPGSDGLRDIMPWTTESTGPGGRFANVPGIQGATVAGTRLLAVYDTRNSEFAASDGSFVKITGELDWVTDQIVTTADPVSNYQRLTLDLRKYKSTVDQNFTFVVRSLVTLTSSADIPFFEQASFGGEFSDRGFVSGRFYGQHSVFASMEMRYLVMRVGLLGMPMEVEMAPFLDVGQVFAGTSFDGTFNVNPGLSLRMLNKPNVGIVSNGAFSQDGFIVTGGVELPF